MGRTRIPSPTSDRAGWARKAAQPDELVTFQIVSPVGRYTGPAHSPAADGRVATSYRLGIADPPGDYTVIARGDQVTEAEATFRVVVAIP